MMPILQDIPVSLSAEDVVATPKQRNVRPEMLHDAKQAIALGETLWQPRAVFDWFDVRWLDGDAVHLMHPIQTALEATLHVGPNASLLEGARQALVSVGTIGPELEREVRALHLRGHSLQSYLLDNAGVLALGAAGAALCCLAEEAAAAHGWGVSEALSPGSLVGWTLHGQRELCSLLPLDTIGVRLNEYCVLEPQKSFSVMIGLGPGYSRTRVGSVCKYCALRHTCWRRREEPE